MAGIKQHVKQIPGIARLKKDADRWMNCCKMISSNQAINGRLAAKRKTEEKVNVVFVCHRPAVWGALHSVYDALKADNRFCVSIVAIPNKKLLPGIGVSHENYESEGAEEFWKDYGCINGYDYKTGKWLDLQSLHPDYIFFQQPYNNMRCDEYESGIVAKYAKICYVSYFAPCEYGRQYDDCLPEDYLRNVSLFFSQNTLDDTVIKKRVNEINRGLTRVCLTGYPKYDYIRNYAVSGMKDTPNDDRYRILWTPRWTTNEGLCSFFDYKDKLVKYCQTDPTIDLTFRPHPQAFSEWERTGELPEKDRGTYLKIFSLGENLHLDQSRDYYPMLFSSDCLLTDMSSIVFDYLLTGKPIVLCMPDHVKNYYNDIMDGLYRVSSWDALTETLKMLRRGEDPLAHIRKNIVSERMNINEESAGNKIAKVIMRDAGLTE